MSPAPRWISITAVSALGVGMLATGAVGLAQAMPLVDSTTTAQVPPISTVPGDVKGLQGMDGSGAMIFPVPASSSVAALPDGAQESQPSPVQQAPAPAPLPVSPDSVSVASPDDSAD